MDICCTCGMPMVKPEDYGNGKVGTATCVHCTNVDGSVKSCEEIFEGGVQFFIQTLGADRTKAERIVRKNMLQLPYWKSLSGSIASDEEFEEIMKCL